MSHDVFISYARQDTHIKHALSRVLDAVGVSYWVDTQSIDVGDYWTDKIVRGIENCRYLFLLASRHSVQSENVRREVYLACCANKKIVPFIVGRVSLPDWTKFPLAGIQYKRIPRSKCLPAFESTVATLFRSVHKPSRLRVISTFTFGLYYYDHLLTEIVLEPTSGIIAIGRDESCDISLAKLSSAFAGKWPSVIADLAFISRYHASLAFADGNYLLTDLTSTNGTFLNGTKIGKRPTGHLVDGSRGMIALS